MTDKSTILIVDDEELIRATLEGLLVAQGHELAFARNGAEALTLAAELTPDLILLDIMMPEMDGFEVCQRLRSDPLLAEVPIIMITALDDRESRLAGIEAGADDFISKPFDSAELQLRVQTVIRLNRYRRLLIERNKFKWVVEQAEDGYLMLNAAGLILYANPQARIFLNLTENESTKINQPFLELAQKDYVCEPKTAWIGWPNQPAIQTPCYLVRPETPTTGSFWLQVDLIEMSSRDNEKYLVRLHDITARVNAQKMMWTFHDQVSHKLRTPLAKLINALKLLNEERSDLSDSDRQFMLSMADSSAIRLHQEIGSIFQYLNTFTTTKSTQTLCSLADIPQIIDQIETSLELQSVNIPNREKLEALSHVYLSIPRQATELILWELLKNSQKFHPNKSPNLEIKITKISNGLKIQVKDDGLTLPPQQLAKMWTPYYQVEKHFSGQVPGMGLGLSMVASLVWSVGGDCQAYNREDETGLIVEIIVPPAINTPVD